MLQSSLRRRNRWNWLLMGERRDEIASVKSWDAQVISYPACAFLGCGHQEICENWSAWIQGYKTKRRWEWSTELTFWGRFMKKENNLKTRSKNRWTILRLLRESFQGTASCLLMNRRLLVLPKIITAFIHRHIFIWASPELCVFVCCMNQKLTRWSLLIENGNIFCLLLSRTRQFLSRFNF